MNVDRKVSEAPRVSVDQKERRVRKANADPVASDSIRYLSPKDIAEALRIHVRDSCRLIKEMPRIKLGRRVRVNVRDFEQFLRERTIRPFPQETPDAERKLPDWAAKPFVVRTEKR